MTGVTTGKPVRAEVGLACEVALRDFAHGKATWEEAATIITHETIDWLTHDIPRRFKKKFRVIDDDVDTIFADFVVRLLMYPKTIVRALESGKSRRAYLWTVADRVGRDHFKRQKSSSEHEVELKAWHLDVTPSPAPSQEDWVLGEEQEKCLDDAMQRLSASDRYLFKQLCSGLAIPELAKELDYTEGQLRRKKNRLLRQLRQFVEEWRI